MLFLLPSMSPVYNLCSIPLFAYTRSTLRTQHRPEGFNRQASPQDCIGSCLKSEVKRSRCQNGESRTKLRRLGIEGLSAVSWSMVILEGDRMSRRGLKVAGSPWRTWLSHTEG